MALLSKAKAKYHDNFSFFEIIQVIPFRNVYFHEAPAYWYEFLMKVHFIGFSLKWGEALIIALQNDKQLSRTQIESTLTKKALKSGFPPTWTADESPIKLNSHLSDCCAMSVISRIPAPDSVCFPPNRIFVKLLFSKVCTWWQQIMRKIS